MSDEIVWRRFGPGFEKPCSDPNMIECAAVECQQANRCRLAKVAFRILRGSNPKHVKGV